MSRAEFSEALAILALEMHCQRHGGVGCGEALWKLVVESVLPQLEEHLPEALHDPSAFRRAALYQEPLEQMLEPQLEHVNALFSVSGATLASWLELTTSLQLGDAMTATMIFGWSLTLRDDTNGELSLTDFVEALCRLSLAVPVPCDDFLNDPDRDLASLDARPQSRPSDFYDPSCWDEYRYPPPEDVVEKLPRKSFAHLSQNQAASPSCSSSCGQGSPSSKKTASSEVRLNSIE